ncbi:glycosyltransferase family 2 protein [Neolewinella lacunae]|uniref:Glycosyltransferase n=1 Tax=Neolewinella lacunae TaxID=1517758 RepID=A0A923PS53_9BACT|nr:glycosyltransferase family 2 protein [Neolewinella lacunae]MBC6996499.1 glycosyltransferase [Neolewinella lacunae]MDN3636652.1 glycosyltransferase family 2 protein [Neolewinella lacunae]
MDLSVVIVSYNVRYFLEQALLSVERAVRGLEVEVWVVDNHSADGSVELVRERFPWVRLIANHHNPGFSVANNQAIRQSSGRYVLLLNPDTVVEEDTFRRCFDFMEAHPAAGGLGVRMIDGTGRFLPESKRGLPTPWVAFTKAFGLARLFPRSRRFNHYHLGYLPQNETHAVEVLSGAYMWMRRKTLDEVGLLDEAFFMYGEDIDLSYRILLGGYQNYYLPTTTIIHYKGESTRRGSLNYVRVFYQAMIIFARKHYAGSQARALVWLMQAAIYVRAALTLLANAWKHLRYPVLDATGIYLGLRVLKSVWANYHFGNPNYFAEHLNYLHLPAYTLLWVGCIFLGGGYDRPAEGGRLLRSMGVGTLLLFAVYGLLPEALRPSRALLLLGAAWAGAWTLSLRSLLHLFRFGNLRWGVPSDQRLLVVGSNAEAERSLQLLQRAGARRNYLGRIVPPGDDAGEQSIGRAEQLHKLVHLYRAEEIIFCSANLSNEAIQRWMSSIGPELQYRILPEASASIIGSQRSDQRGTLYTIDVKYRIDDPANRRAKWLLDKGLALLLLLLSPFLSWFLPSAGRRATAALRVLAGHQHWVGYAAADPQPSVLPRLKTGVFHPGSGTSVSDAETLQHLDFLYARDYRLADDWRIFWRGLWEKESSKA